VGAWGFGKKRRGIFHHKESDFGNNEIPLALLSPGSEGTVSHINAGRGLWSKLFGMGIGVGSRIKVLANDYRGIIILVGNMKFALGRGMAMKIFVKPLK